MFQLEAAQTLTRIGNAKFMTGSYPEALEYLQEAISEFEHRGRHRNIALVMRQIGHVRLRQGLIEEAWHHFEKSSSYRGLTFFGGLTSVEDAAHRSTLLSGMGTIRVIQGRLDDAWLLYSQALEAIGGLPSGRWPGALSSNRSKVQKAIAGEVIREMANLKTIQGRFDEALNLLQQSNLYTHDSHSLYVNQLLMGSLKASIFQYEEAFYLLNASSSGLKAIGAYGVAATATLMLADLHLRSAQVQQALTLLEESIAMFVSNGDRRGAAFATSLKGQVLASPLS